MHVLPYCNIRCTAWRSIGGHCFTGTCIVDALLSLGVVQNRVDGCARALELLHHNCMQCVADEDTAAHGKTDEQKILATKQSSNRSPIDSSNGSRSWKILNTSSEGCNGNAPTFPTLVRRNSWAASPKRRGGRGGAGGGGVVFHDNFSFYVFRTYPRPIFDPDCCEDKILASALKRDARGQGEQANEAVACVKEICEGVLECAGVSWEPLFDSERIHSVIGCLGKSMVTKRDLNVEIQVRLWVTIR